MKRHVSTQGKTHGPRFWWQGVLILLPVCLLAGVGVWTLRLDRIAAEEELKERAASFATEAARRLEAALFPPLASDPAAHRAHLAQHGIANYYELWVSASGEESPRVPVTLRHQPRRLPLAGLTETQKTLWQELESSLADPAGRPRAREIVQLILTESWPAAFAAQAAYELGVLELAEGRTNAALAAFERALPLATNQWSAAGLPLAQLVQLRLLELWPMETLERERARAEERWAATGWAWPKAVHPWLFENMTLLPSPVCRWQAEVADRRRLPNELWRLLPATSLQSNAVVTHLQYWEYTRERLLAQEEILQWRKTQTNASLPRLFWFGEDRRWLAIPASVWKSSNTHTSDAISLIALPEESVRSLISRALSEVRQRPPQVGLTVALAGRAVNMPLWPGTGTHGKPMTSSATFISALAGETTEKPLAEATGNEVGKALEVKAWLVHRAEFYERVRQRTRLFGGLLAAAVAAALAGLWAAYRAFRQQCRLAEMKSNFVSSVTHELRAPLASVRLMAESLEGGKVSEPAKQQEYFRFITQECRRLGALIENVLDYARIEEGRKQYDMEPVDALALVRATVGLMVPVAQQRNIRLQIELDEAALDKLQPQWDGRAIQQALLNLVDNAIKYSPSGTTVTVGLNSEGQRLHLWVKDQGIGIPKEEWPRIFERFYRAGTELRREAQGVGIGLSLVKHIVEAHGGRVRVHSAPGQGSCFVMELPVARAST